MILESSQLHWMLYLTFNKKKKEHITSTFNGTVLPHVNTSSKTYMYAYTSHTQDLPSTHITHTRPSISTHHKYTGLSVTTRHTHTQAHPSLHITHTQVHPSLHVTHTGPSITTHHTRACSHTCTVHTTHLGTGPLDQLGKRPFQYYLSVGKTCTCTNVTGLMYST